VNDLIDDYAEAIEAIAAAHKRGHLLGLCYAVLTAKHAADVRILGEPEALELIATEIADSDPDQITVN
jgi:hypothetical protein